MIIIPLEEICSKSQALKALLSDDIGIRVSEFDASKTINAPYVVWQIINANPEQYLSGVSDMDDSLVQIDVYSTSKSNARQIAKLLKNAISEDYCYVEAFSGTEREPNTDLYRVRLDTRWYEDS
jgi:hypothetical protein